MNPKPPNHVISFQAERLVGQIEDLARTEMQILLVLHGAARLKWSQGEESIGSGDLISIRPGIVHSWLDCEALQIVRCGFNSRSLKKKVGAAFDAKALSVILDSTEVKRYQIPSDKFRSIASLLSASSAGGDMGNIGRVLLLLETIVEHSKVPIPSVHHAVFEAVQAFDSDIAKDWSLPEIAEFIDLDPSYVARLFTANLGTPPLSYLALLRAEDAALMLATEAISCAAVGAAVGWHDANYFSRRFRQHFGESPTTFRDRRRGA